MEKQLVVKYECGHTKVLPITVEMVFGFLHSKKATCEQCGKPALTMETVVSTEVPNVSDLSA